MVTLATSTAKTFANLSACDGWSTRRCVEDAN
nr:MAG TPA: hypothetical protein [Caudoviricetes sp.]